MSDYKFGNFLCELREAKGLTQLEIANMLDVTPAAVSKWENGESKPRIETLFKLAEILDVTAEELMAGEHTVRQNNETIEKQATLVGGVWVCKKRYILISCKIFLLVILLVVFDFFAIVIVNNFIDEKQFDSSISGMYSYEDIFAHSEDENIYYISRAYYNDNIMGVGNDFKYDYSYKILKDVKFKSISPAVASIIKSYVSSKSIIGYCCLNGGEIEGIPVNYDIQEAGIYLGDKAFVTWADFYLIFGRVYMLARFKDTDIEIDPETKLINAVNCITIKSKEIAMFELENIDLEQLKIGDEQKTFYDKPFKNLLERPYSYISVIVLLLELFVVIAIIKRNTGNGSKPLKKSK